MSNHTETIFDATDTLPELVINFGYPDEYLVRIAKVGGGTIGQAYEGRWIVEIADRWDKIVLTADDFVTGTPKTHEQAARIALDFLSEMLDECPRCGWTYGRNEAAHTH